MTGGKITYTCIRLWHVDIMLFGDVEKLAEMHVCRPCSTSLCIKIDEHTSRNCHVLWCNEEVVTWCIKYWMTLNLSSASHRESQGSSRFELLADSSDHKIPHIGKRWLIRRDELTQVCGLPSAYGFSFETQSKRIAKWDELCFVLAWNKFSKLQ